MSLLGSTDNVIVTDKQREYGFTAADFMKISTLIYDRVGICLPGKKAEMAYNRLSRRLRALGLGSFSAYLEHLTRHEETEWAHFVGALTTHLTSFFREEHHFPILAQHAARKAGEGRVRLWSCAASTGEEPYSMAIAMAEQFDSLCPPVEITATDVDPGVLDIARSGVYPLERIETLSSRIIRRYFLRGEGDNRGYVKIRPEIRRLVTFHTINLLDHVWELTGEYDAVFCRNVMIYFDRATQKKVLQHCRRHLAADGLFFAGHSENLNHVADLFEPCGKTVYRPQRPAQKNSPAPGFATVCYA